MKLRLTLLYFFLSCMFFIQAQNTITSIRNLKHALEAAPNAEDRVLALTGLCNEYSTVSFDSANLYGREALSLAQQTHFTAGEIKALCYLGIANTRHGEMAKALQLQFRGLQIAQENKNEINEALCLFGIGHSYYFLRDNPKAINYCKKAWQLLLSNKEETCSFYSYFNTHLNKSRSVYTEIELVIGEAYLYDNQLDSAITWLQRLYDPLTDPFWINIVRNFLGGAYFKSGKQQLGLQYLRDAADFNLKNQNPYDLAWSYAILSACFKEMNLVDSAIYYAKLGLSAAQKVAFKNRVLETSQLLATEYEHLNNIDESNKYLKLAFAANNELFGQAKVFELQKTLAEEQQHQMEAEKQQLTYRNRVRQTALISGIGIIMIIALILFRNNRQKQITNTVLANTLADLKSTQSQLIQSEKMASLGELTAGIAHEIQNPLNFVNNFSEVNKELIEELESERSKVKGERNEPLENEIIQDIKSNEEKINHHGKRADAIVKGMLQHSLTSSGQKEPTDINALCDEYLRLAYHGFRAKDKSFNAHFETDFDPSLEKIRVVPQDIGRVVLNLINNAFYAVNEKAKGLTPNAESYVPTVTVSTKKIDSHSGPVSIEIKIADNGNGIPDAIKEKIFQPFFTTKPTGSGTGLGLSLSYDIAKAHGGELILSNSATGGCVFTLRLPAS